jgi:phospholipid transport system substrate-binding protein
MTKTLAFVPTAFGPAGRRLAAVMSAMLVSAILILGAARPADAQAIAGDPGDFVRGFTSEAIAALADQTLPVNRREAEFRRLLVANFDMERIGRFVLGRYWRKASEAQRAEFHRLFEDMTVISYSQRLSQYGGESLKVGGVRNQTEKGITVSSLIVRAKGAPIPVNWRLRRTGDGWRVVDVMIEGVSMAITQRQEMGAVIKSAGGRVDGLLDKLREATARLNRGAGLKADASS